MIVLRPVRFCVNDCAIPRECSCVHASMREYSFVAYACIRISAKRAQRRTRAELLVWLFRIRRWISLRWNRWIRGGFASGSWSGVSARFCSRITSRTWRHLGGAIRRIGRWGIARRGRVSGRRIITRRRCITRRCRFIRGCRGRRCSSDGNFNSQGRCQFSDRSQHRGAGA